MGEDAGSEGGHERQLEGLEDGVWSSVGTLAAAGQHFDVKLRTLEKPMQSERIVKGAEDSRVDVLWWEQSTPTSTS